MMHWALPEGPEDEYITLTMVTILDRSNSKSSNLTPK